MKTPHAGDRRFAGGDLGRFFDLSTDLLCVVGFDGYFHLLSPSWSRLLGYSDDELTVRVIGAPHVPVVGLVRPEPPHVPEIEHDEVRRGRADPWLVVIPSEAEGTVAAERVAQEYGEVVQVQQPRTDLALDEAAVSAPRREALEREGDF